MNVITFFLNKNHLQYMIWWKVFLVLCHHYMKCSFHLDPCKWNLKDKLNFKENQFPEMRAVFCCKIRIVIKNYAVFFFIYSFSIQNKLRTWLNKTEGWYPAFWFGNLFSDIADRRTGIVLYIPKKYQYKTSILIWPIFFSFWLDCFLLWQIQRWKKNMSMNSLVNTLESLY